MLFDTGVFVCQMTYTRDDSVGFYVRYKTKKFYFLKEGVYQNNVC